MAFYNWVVKHNHNHGLYQTFLLLFGVINPYLYFLASKQEFLETALFSSVIFVAIIIQNYSKNNGFYVMHTFKWCSSSSFSSYISMST